MLFKKKVEYEDEKRPVPAIWTLFLAILLIGGMFIGALKFTSYVERLDMERQYGEPYVEMKYNE